MNAIVCNVMIVAVKIDGVTLQIVHLTVCDPIAAAHHIDGSLAGIFQPVGTGKMTVMYRVVARNQTFAVPPGEQHPPGSGVVYVAVGDHVVKSRLIVPCGKLI